MLGEKGNTRASILRRVHELANGGEDGSDT